MSVVLTYRLINILLLFILNLKLANEKLFIGLVRAQLFNFTVYIYIVSENLRNNFNKELTKCDFLRNNSST